MTKMSNVFKGWERYSDEEMEKIIKEGVISVDANILLNFFRYSSKSSQELTTIFTKLKSRIVLTYYVAKEYYENKNRVIRESINKYDETISKFKKEYSVLNEIVEKLNKNKFSLKKDIKELIEKNEKEVISMLEKEKNEKNKIFTSRKLEENILKIFDDNLLEKHDLEIFEEMKKEGLRRFEEEIPPGYKDASKGENGDYYIFKSLIDYAKKENKHLIFITDDNKQDWFEEIHGVKQARPELLNEFYNSTNNNLILILSLDQFIKIYYEKIVEKEVNQTLINEIINMQKTNKYKIINHDIRNMLRFLYNNMQDERILKNKSRIVHYLTRIKNMSMDYPELKKDLYIYQLLLLLLENEQLDDYRKHLSDICERRLFCHIDRNYYYHMNKTLDNDLNDNKNKMYKKYFDDKVIDEFEKNKEEYDYYQLLKTINDLSEQAQNNAEKQNINV